MTDVTHYGVHWTQHGIAYLHQAEGGENVVGVPDPSPFVVKQKRPCNHQILISGPDEDIPWEVLSDPLVQALAPVPHVGENIFFIEMTNEVWPVITQLVQMSSPSTHSCVVPIWTKLRINPLDLEETNVQPLIISGLAAKHTQVVKQLAEISYLTPRTILLVGDQDVVLPQPIVRIKTGLGEHNLGHPWRRLGACLLRRYMRNPTKWQQTG